MIKTICNECESIYYVYPSETNTKYCSKLCYEKSRSKNNKTIKCKQCTKKFLWHQCRPNKKFCSKICYHTYYIEHREPIKTFCLICKKELIVYTKTEIKKTCSKECKNKLNGLNHKNRTWKMNDEGRKKISIGRKKYLSNSENLKKHGENTRKSWLNIITRKSRLTQERANKISITGRKLYRLGIKKPSFNPNSRYSKITKYKNILFRSTWEAKVAEWLDKNNIKWEYESKQCIVSLPTGRSYFIDFYLPELNKYIEVKGQLDDYSIYKMDEACIQNYDLYIIDSQNINNISLDCNWKDISKLFIDYLEDGGHE